LEYDNRTHRLKEPVSRGWKLLLLGGLALALSVVGALVDSHRFWFSYLTAYLFWLTVALGGLFFVMLHHLVNATWSVVLRRIVEGIMAVLPFMAIFFIPIVFAMHDLFHWSDPEVMAHDSLLAKKQAYLNTGFFLVRSLIYFAVWFFLTWRLYRISLEQDRQPDENQLKRARRISAPGMILFAITTTFAAFDWMMSLDAHWYSTIFGAYVFAGAVLGGLSLLTLVTLVLGRPGVMEGILTVEHRHDLAKLIFAFVIFWAYMAFSQYFLMWYANIPEETIWYRHRWEGTWRILSLLLVFGHFVLPFVLLLTRAAKRSVVMVGFISVWLLLMHWVDIYWVVMPSMGGHGWHPSWIDLTTIVGVGGVFLWYFWLRLIRRPLVPVGDPKLQASIKFTNPW
jgi:hypothetical protein